MREGRLDQFTSTKETHPPAGTLVLVRTGASKIWIYSSHKMWELKFPEVYLRKAPTSILNLDVVHGLDAVHEAEWQSFFVHWK